MILAGASINLISGESGILKKAEMASGKTKESKIAEQLEMCKIMKDMDDKSLKDILISEGMIDSEELEQNGIASIAGSENFLVLSGSKGLNLLSSQVDSGKDFTGVEIYLVDDVILDVEFNEETGELISGEAFEPIGNENTMFNGTFDGQNHMIENLYINQTNVRDIRIVFIYRKKWCSSEYNSQKFLYKR